MTEIGNWFIYIINYLLRSPFLTLFMFILIANNLVVFFRFIGRKTRKNKFKKSIEKRAKDNAYTSTRLFCSKCDLPMKKEMSSRSNETQYVCPNSPNCDIVVYEKSY